LKTRKFYGESSYNILTCLQS